PCAADARGALARHAGACRAALPARYGKSQHPQHLSRGTGDRALEPARGPGIKEVTMPNDTVVTASEPELNKLIAQYECGPVHLAGTANGLYERHLMFDNVVDKAAAGARERYEAVARSTRDILSQRWLRTDRTYESANPKRIYYVSMEFLIGR